jgi:LMBR1 domain-containing protein 1
MNSFLFNINLILLSSISVTHFCALAFKEYVSMTDIDLIFGTQIKYLRFFVYFYKYNIFIYALFTLMFISFIYLICRPNDRNSLENQIGKSGPSEALIESIQSSGLSKY